MKAYCLASSSSGNCYILEFEIEGKPTRIMVECGLPYREIIRRSNTYSIDLSTIKCCLVTHAHGDHSKAMKDLIRVGIPVYSSLDTYNVLKMDADHVLKELIPTTVTSGIKVMGFEVEHDIKGAYGFVIKTTSNETVIFINDHKRFTRNLTAFKPNYVFIECNYYHTMVYEQFNALKKLKKSGQLSEEELKETNVEIAQLDRNINAHCSLHGTIKGLEKLNLKECRTIFLMHLSDRYANEYVMKNSIQTATGVMTLICGKNGGGIK